MTTPKNKIGELEFASIEAPNGIPAYGMTLAQIERPGVDGTLWARQGKRGERFQINTVATFRRDSAANQAISSYNLMRSQIVDVTINDRTYSNILILSVRCDAPRQLIAASNGDSLEVRCVWEGFVNA